MAPPPLTDAQKRTDEYFDHLVSLWNQMDPRVRSGPEGMGLADQIVGLARRRNGDAAAGNLTKQLLQNTSGALSGDQLRDTLDSRSPRVDSRDNATVTTPDTPAINTSSLPANTAHGVAGATPGDGRKWLPGNSSLPPIAPADSTHIDAADAAIEDVNHTNFLVDPAKAWNPGGATLPVTGSNISTLGSTYTLANDLLPKCALAVEALRDAFSGSGEQLIAGQLDRIREPLKTLADGTAASKDLPGMIANGGIAANNAFHALRGQQFTVRQAMADIAAATIKLIEESTAKVGISTGSVAIPIDAAAVKYQVLATMAGAYASLPPVSTPDAVADARKIGQQIGALAAKVPTPATLSVHTDNHDRDQGRDQDRARNGGRGHGAPVSTVSTPGGGLPGGGGAAMPKSGPGGAGDGDLAKLLSMLGQGVPALAQRAAGVPQQVAGIPQQTAAAAAPLTSAAQQAPAELLNTLRGDKAANAKLSGTGSPAATAAAADRAAATSTTYTPPGAASPASLGSPGSDARPHQLDALGRPVDKDHNGKIDKDAVPLSKRTIKPFDLSVPAGGHNVQVIPEGAGPVKTTAAFAFACFGASWSWLGASK